MQQQQYNDWYSLQGRHSTLFPCVATLFTHAPRPPPFLHHSDPESQAVAVSALPIGLTPALWRPRRRTASFAVATADLLDGLPHDRLGANGSSSSRSSSNSSTADSDANPGAGSGHGGLADTTSPNLSGAAGALVHSMLGTSVDLLRSGVAATHTFIKDMMVTSPPPGAGPAAPPQAPALAVGVSSMDDNLDTGDDSTIATATAPSLAPAGEHDRTNNHNNPHHSLMRGVCVQARMDRHQPTLASWHCQRGRLWTTEAACMTRSPWTRSWLQNGCFPQ